MGGGENDSKGWGMEKGDGYDSEMGEVTEGGKKSMTSVNSSLTLDLRN